MPLPKYFGSDFPVVFIASYKQGLLISYQLTDSTDVLSLHSQPVWGGESSMLPQLMVTSPEFITPTVS